MVSQGQRAPWWSFWTTYTTSAHSERSSTASSTAATKTGSFRLHPDHFKCSSASFVISLLSLRQCFFCRLNKMWYSGIKIQVFGFFLFPVLTLSALWAKPHRPPPTSSFTTTSGKVLQISSTHSPSWRQFVCRCSWTFPPQTLNVPVWSVIRWVLCANHMEPVKGFLGRYLRRKLIEMEISSRTRSMELVKIIDWIPRVWHHLNRFLETHSSSDVTIGRRNYAWLKICQL